MSGCVNTGWCAANPHFAFWNFPQVFFIHGCLHPSWLESADVKPAGMETWLCAYTHQCSFQEPQEDTTWTMYFQCWSCVTWSWSFCIKCEPMFVCVYSSVSLFAQAVSLNIRGPHASAPDHASPPRPPPPTARRLAKDASLLAGELACFKPRAGVIQSISVGRSDCLCWPNCPPASETSWGYDGGCLGADGPPASGWAGPWHSGQLHLQHPRCVSILMEERFS